MQTTIHATWDQANGWSRHASSAPVNANGRANTEWLKRTNDRYVASFRICSVSRPKLPTGHSGGPAAVALRALASLAEAWRRREGPPLRSSPTTNYQPLTTNH